MTASRPVLEMQGIVKEFPGVRALDDVSFSLRAGEVLALVGENGAGKSTLMKVLSGVYPAGTYRGTILRDGAPVTFAGTADAEKAGIAIIHQELNLFPELTVVENLYMGRFLRKKGLGLLDWGRMEREAGRVLREMGVGFGPRTLVRELSVGDAQMVEIARALMKDAQILIFDEPTSALSETEIRRLYGFIEERRARGAACVYISHKLDEVYKLCSRAVVLRDGRSVGGGSLPELTRDRLVALMVGRELTALYPEKLAKPAAGQRPGLVVEDLRVRRLDAHDGKAPEVRGVGFEAYPGEIVGLGGMMGSGRTELLYGIFGHPDYRTTGRVTVDGKPVPRGDIAAMVAAKVGLVTEDRKATGLHLGMTIRENVSMASLGQVSRGGFIQDAEEKARAKSYMTRLRVKAPSSETVVGTLSGGNQQKVALAKWAALPPKVLMLDEPTRGVDVGAKFEIYALLRELAASGVTVVVASSEIPELIGICHRVLILRDGTLAGALEGTDVTAENILHRAIGGRS